MSHRAVRAIQAYVRHALAAAKIQESKGHSKYHILSDDRWQKVLGIQFKIYSVVYFRT